MRAAILLTLGGIAYVTYLAITTPRDWPNHYPVANVAFVAGLATPIAAVLACVWWLAFRRRKDPS